jgi:hypothetical protein
MRPTPHAGAPAGARAPLPQPPPRAWSAALAPSQRRAAERRRAASERRTAQDWLRSLARR